MTKRWPPPGFPIVEGHYALTPRWSVELPAQFCRRIEDGSMVLWRPNVTIWIDIFNQAAPAPVRSREERRDAIVETASTKSFLRDTDDGGVWWLAYRLREPRDDGAVVEALMGFAIDDASQVQMGIYFDDAKDEVLALAIYESLAPVRPAPAPARKGAA